MEIKYADDKLQEQCTSLKAAQKLFGGDKAHAVSLLARVNALQSAETIKDISVQPQFRFHKLENKGRKALEGYFAIDVRNRTSPWRLIIQPLDDNGEPFVPCNIDEVADSVRIVGIVEVSRHYE
ncbi:MAG: hypothetical protein K6F54_09370 [Lachnospiraceae bacterium]|nr:hypothetical protein [Lachnospiraceae bacterium]